MLDFIIDNILCICCLVNVCLLFWFPIMRCDFISCCILNFQRKIIHAYLGREKYLNKWYTVKEERANRVLCRYDPLNFYVEVMMHIPFFDIYVINVDDNRREALRLITGQTPSWRHNGYLCGSSYWWKLCWALFTI